MDRRPQQEAGEISGLAFDRMTRGHGLFAILGSADTLTIPVTSAQRRPESELRRHHDLDELLELLLPRSTKAGV